MKEQSLATVEPKTELAFVPNEENIALLKKTLGSQNINLTDSELQLTIYQATKTGLDPLSKQIYPMKDKSGRMSFITAIDGYRLIAQRTGKYRGQLGPFWCGADGEWKEVWLGSGQPAAAKVGVLHADFTEPLWAVARFSSYGKTTGQWPTMGDIMIAKCAEALALRKAFPQELSDLYTREEMDQAGDRDKVSADQTPPPPKEPKSMTMGEALAEIGHELKAKGFDDDKERRVILINLAGVKSFNEIKAAKMIELLAIVKGAAPSKLKTFLPDADGSYDDKKPAAAPVEEPEEGEVVEPEPEDMDK